MGDNADLNIVASEQNAVLKDLRKWFKDNIDWFKDKRLTISSLDLTENNVTIVPIKGIKKRRQYACGGYQVYFPFAIYYRTSASTNTEIENVFVFSLHHTCHDTKEWQHYR